MKKMTFAVWFTALLAVFTFSSCLDSDDNATRAGSEIVQVTGYMGLYSFQSAGGYEIIPSNQSAINMTIETKYAYVTYSYQTADVVEGMKKLKAEIYSLLPIPDKMLNSNVEAIKTFANAPIRNITYGASYEFFPISFWDVNTMFLPINYFIKDSSDKEALKKEVQSHNFEVFYDLNDPAMESSNDLILYVRHNVMEPELNKDRNFRVNTNIYWMDLRYVMSSYEQKNGKKPSRLIIQYEQNATGEYDEHQIVPTRVEIDYSAILQSAEKK